MKAMSKLMTAEQAVKHIHSGNRVFVQAGAATPKTLLTALEGRSEELREVELVCLSLHGQTGLENETHADRIRFNTFFVSKPLRHLVKDGYADYIPVFLSEIHKLFETGRLALDVALIHVSPPDKHGFCSLGVSVDITRSALKYARLVIAQVNPKMPRTLGDGIIHVDEINYMVEVNDDLPEIDYRPEIGECEETIARHCADLVDNGATIQLGIGTIPDAVCSALSHHKDIGIHTEMFSNGVIDLMKQGVITNHFKKKHRGKVITTFAMGTRELYDFIDDNPEINFLESSYVNDERIIRTNPKVVAVNSAIEVDLTGQVCADSIGTMQYSGVGGQMDFIRGASMSDDGIPIIAMASMTGKGKSKIVPKLTDGAGVVTTRAHVHWVITEYGKVNLFGLNLRQRAKALINISHPNHREELSREAHERFGSNFFSFLD